MAFLDSSGDIVIDAVLTDIGRRKLAQNDSSFRIVAYTLADDEIDYSLFQPNTSSVFVDLDILNTPIFEANVNDRINLNFPLMTITNPNLKYLPKLTPDNTGVSIGEEKGLAAGTTVRFYQDTNQNARIVPAEIQDTLFRVEVANDFLLVENESPVDFSPYGTGIYVIQRDAQLIQASQGSQVTFKLRPQTLNNVTWNTFGVGTVGGRTIQTKVRCMGLNSGLSSIVTVTINEEFRR